jgi:hypothetical protein
VLHDSVSLPRYLISKLFWLSVATFGSFFLSSFFLGLSCELPPMPAETKSMNPNAKARCGKRDMRDSLHRPSRIENAQKVGYTLDAPALQRVCNMAGLGRGELCDRSRIGFRSCRRHISMTGSESYPTADTARSESITLHGSRP